MLLRFHLLVASGGAGAAVYLRRLMKLWLLLWFRLALVIVILVVSASSALLLLMMMTEAGDGGSRRLCYCGGCRLVLHGSLLSSLCSLIAYLSRLLSMELRSSRRCHSCACFACSHLPMLHVVLLLL